MGWKDITPGDKIAKTVGARWIKSSTGKMGLEVAFEFEEPSTSSREKLNWVGWLTKDALQNTMDTLVSVLGYNGSEDADENGILKDKKAFDLDREVRLVVEMETNPNNNKEYPKVKWVNSMGGSAFAGVSVDTVKTELLAIGFKAAFLASKQSAGGSSAKTKAPSQDEEIGPPIDPNDLPF